MVKLVEEKVKERCREAMKDIYSNFHPLYVTRGEVACYLAGFKDGVREGTGLKKDLKKKKVV
jgi:hypothetical protein